VTAAAAAAATTIKTVVTTITALATKVTSVQNFMKTFFVIFDFQSFHQTFFSKKLKKVETCLQMSKKSAK